MYQNNWNPDRDKLNLLVANDVAGGNIPLHMSCDDVDLDSLLFLGDDTMYVVIVVHG